MRTGFLLVVAFFVCGAGAAVAAGSKPSGNVWSAVARPSSGPAQAIGGAAAGCLAGAARLPMDGPGYEVIRLSRRRYFGHPTLIDFIEGFGKRSQAAGLPVFYVGDMSQPRGGPLPFGHASHQTGIDADIWFTLDTKPGLPVAAREEPSLPSMIHVDTAAIDPAHFSRRQVELLKLAVADPRVDRVFVNPVIKLALCRGYGGATEGGRDWLHKLRPWWGHDDHFHVRLTCPRDSPACEPQLPIPPGDGCDAALEDWTHREIMPSPSHAPRPLPKLPQACESLLDRK